MRAGLATISPYGLAPSSLGKVATGEWFAVASASMEAEILDSQTNTQIGAAVDSKPGSKLAGFTTWGGAKEAFEFWPKRLRKWLDENHGKSGI